MRCLPNAFQHPAAGLGTAGCPPGDVWLHGPRCQEKQSLLSPLSHEEGQRRCLRTVPPPVLHCRWVVVLQKEPNQSPAGLAPCFRGCNKRSLLPTALILCTFLHSHQIPWVFRRVREEAPAPLLLYKAAVSTTTLRRWGKRGRHGTGPSCAVGLEAPRRAPAPRHGFVWPQLPGELRLPKQTASPNPTQQQQQRRFN